LGQQQEQQSPPTHEQLRMCNVHDHTSTHDCCPCVLANGIAEQPCAESALLIKGALSVRPLLLTFGGRFPHGRHRMLSH
jgi:hypothetical protein